MNLVCDLDGVVYRGEELIPGSDAALQTAAEAGLRLWFVTNNSTRTPIEVRDKIRRVTGYEPSEEQIVTSSQAAASMVSGEEGPAYVLGSAAIDQALAEVGIQTTSDPKEARTVLVGMDRALTYERLAGAVSAVRLGARFIATNDDPTFPVEDGFEPGSGAMVAAVSVASGFRPEIAGKPHRPMQELLSSRVAGPAWVIGDRIDTDIALAAGRTDWRSIVVLTGVTTSDDEVDAADHVALDLAGAVDLVLDQRSRR
jgi:4-nitrophenyl phosphatase